MSEEDAVEEREVRLRYCKDPSKWLSEQLGRDIKPGESSLVDAVEDIDVDGKVPVDVLMVIIGKALIRTATVREWAAFKRLCEMIAPTVDMAVEVWCWRKTHQ